MTKQEISLHNEALAIKKIQNEFNKNGLLGAMRLCQDCMGVDARAAYEKVNVICNAVKENMQ